MTDRNKQNGRPLCLHCHQRPATKPRGLCWGCYERPGVRLQYSVAFRCEPGNGVANSRGKRPRKATVAKPGTAAKVAELEARAARGESLWHPEDATFEDTLGETG